MLEYTKEELNSIHKKRLNELASYCGGYSFLSRMLGIPSTTVQGWKNRGRISREGARRVENHERLNVKFKASYLRVDLNNFKNK